MKKRTVILGTIAAVGATTLAVVIGDKNKVSYAQELMQEADSRYKQMSKKLEQQKGVAQEELSKLEALKELIWEELKRFTVSYEKTGNKMKLKELKTEQFELSKYDENTVIESDYHVTLRPVVLTADLNEGLLKGNHYLEKAYEAEWESEKAVIIMSKSFDFLTDLIALSVTLRNELNETFAVYCEQVTTIEQMIEEKSNTMTFTDDEELLIDNTMELTKVLYDLTKGTMLSRPEEPSEQVYIFKKYIHEVIEKMTKLREEIE